MRKRFDVVRAKIAWKRMLCLGLTTVMLLETAGCGGGNGAEPSSSEELVVSVSAEESGEQSVESETQASEGAGEENKIAKEEESKKRSVRDYYEEINAEYLEAVLKEDPQFSAYIYSTQKKVDKQIIDLLEEADLESLSPDEDFYKVVKLYQQLKDTETREKTANADIKKFLDKIDQVKNLNDLYKLYRNKDYTKLNALMTYSVVSEFYQCGYPLFRPSSLFATKWKEEVTPDLEDMLCQLGYSESRAKEIVANAKEFDDYLYDFCDKNIWKAGVFYFYQEQLDQKKVTFPVLDIMKSLGATNEWEGFLAPSETLELWKEVYQQENVAKLRDHMLVTGLLAFADLGNEQMVKTYYSLCEKQDDSIPAWENEMEAGILRTIAEDTLADAYCKKYLDDEIIPMAEEMAKTVSNEMKNLIGEINYLTIDGEKQLKNKLLYIKANYGRNSIQDDLSDVTLTDNLFENILAFRVSRFDFANQQLGVITEEFNRDIYQTNMLGCNAQYYGRVNAYGVNAGWLCMDGCGKDAAYEERLASLGMIIAHELAHAYDPTSILREENGYYYEWMEEREQKGYGDYIQKILDYYDGKETSNGEKIDGKAIVSETFADLNAMAVCLRILAKQENPDYDLFFSTWTRLWYINPKYENSEMFESEKYLPNRERANYILGHFKEFYDTYDVAEDGPCYVPEEDRLPAF